jgi:hypothetical protein
MLHARLVSSSFSITRRSPALALDGQRLTRQAPEHQAGHGGVNPGLFRLRQALIVLAQTPRPIQPTERALNGLITNDKFCLTRTGRLTLTWSRRRPQPPGPSSGGTAYPSDGQFHRGGTYETPPVEHSPRTEIGLGRTAPLGSGLPAPSAMDVVERAGAQTRPDSDAGGVR